jgi:hypothetical protein
VNITTDRDSETQRSERVPAGVTVTYLGHVPGGMISVEFEDGRRDIMHPHAFAEFRD